MIRVEVLGLNAALASLDRLGRAESVVERLQKRARRVADAARRDTRSSRIAASVQVRDRADGAEVVIGEGVPFALAHASKSRQARFGRRSYISRAGKIAYSKLRPKRKR